MFQPGKIDLNIKMKKYIKPIMQIFPRKNNMCVFMHSVAKLKQIWSIRASERLDL